MSTERRNSRQPMRERPPEERVHNFEEVPLGYSPEEARAEAQRCLQCAAPQCIKGCPVKVQIPEFVALIAEGRFVEAAPDRRDQRLSCDLRPRLSAGEAGAALRAGPP